MASAQIHFVHYDYVIMYVSGDWSAYAQIMSSMM